jgi:drug/metabolite transporter (DMT)-like permease
LFAGLLLLGIARATGVPLGRHPNEKWLWIVNTLLAFAVSYGVVYWAEQWVPSGLASILFATYVLFLALFGWYGLPGERASAAEALGLVLGFAGVAIIYSADFDRLGGTRTYVASVVFLASPAASALATVFVKRWGKGIHALSLTAVPMFLTGIVMGAAAALFERDRSYTFDSASVGALVYLTVFGTAVTFTLYYWLLAFLPAKRMGLIAYLIPLIAVAIGTLRGETLTLRIVLGAALVLLGVGLAIHVPSRSKGA